MEYARIVGESNCADTVVDEALCSQPHVVIFSVNDCNGDVFSLLQNIKEKLPGAICIVVGTTSNVMFRVRSRSSDANMILDQQSGPDKIIAFLKKMASELDRDKSLASKDYLRVVKDSNGKSAWSKLFSLMDERPESMMLADNDLVLRHANPAILDTFKELESFLPDKPDCLVGKPVDVFHKKLSRVRNIICDARNLPYNTQIIIGPKIFDLKVRSVYPR